MSLSRGWLLERFPGQGLAIFELVPARTGCFSVPARRANGNRRCFDSAPDERAG
jgi:hypothetical protein